jgi:hypothetical protein
MCTRCVGRERGGGRAGARRRGGVWERAARGGVQSTFGFLGLVLALLCLCILVMSVWTPDQLPLVETLQEKSYPPLALHFSLLVYIAVASLNALSFTGYGVPQLVDMALLLSAVPLAVWGALFFAMQHFEVRLAWLPLGGVVYSGAMKFMHRELREGWLHIGRLRKTMYKHDSA